MSLAMWLILLLLSASRPLVWFENTFRKAPASKAPDRHKEIFRAAQDKTTATKDRAARL
jgi:hypothetical protein